MSPKKAAGAFGTSFGEILDRHGRTQSALASQMGTTRGYISQLATGQKGVSATTVENISDALGVSAEERLELHRAAAKDAGFRIDLPDDF